MQGKPRAVDSIDFWPLLLAHSTWPPHGGAPPAPPPSPPLLREYLPTTESSIIWRGRWKLITSAGLGGSYWRPPNGVGPNNTMLMNRTAWPCTNATATGAGCLVCSPEKPCLFGEQLALQESLSGLAANQPSRLLLGRPGERRVRAREYCNATSKSCGSVGPTAGHLRGSYSNPKHMLQTNAERRKLRASGSSLPPRFLLHADVRRRQDVGRGAGGLRLRRAERAHRARILGQLHRAVLQAKVAACGEWMNRRFAHVFE